MTKINFRSCLPYAIALIIFILIAYIYASPVLEGKIINQADISSYQGAAKERDDYKKTDRRRIFLDQFDVQWHADNHDRSSLQRKLS